MPTEEKLRIVPGELAQIVEAVFENMIGLEAGWCDAPWYASGDRLAAAVHLSGAWNGTVLVECGRREACAFTGRFLSSDAPPQVDDVVRDMLGELANMIGGNLKCVLARGIHLSMPEVVDGDGRGLGAPGEEVRERLGFQCPEGSFWVTVLAARP